MPRGKRTPPEQKAKAAAALLTGSTMQEAADAAGIPVRTVENFKRELRESGELKTWDYGALVGEYLATNIEARTAHVRLFGDVAWIERTPADKIQALAVLHGVLDDKAFRLLAAWRQPSTDPGLDAEREPIDGSVERSG